MARADKKSFIVYYDWEDAFLSLDTDEERAQLCMAMFAYAIRREVPENLSPTLRFGFQFMKNCMDRDFEKYEAICRERAIAGAMGGRPAALKPNGYTDNQKVYKKPDNDKGKDKGKDYTYYDKLMSAIHPYLTTIPSDESKTLLDIIEKNFK